MVEGGGRRGGLTRGIERDQNKREAGQIHKATGRDGGEVVDPL